ncbi:MAG: hypothetical protein IKW38_00255 [Kiritimatiellae bacterium]|nr:hypothetical protein [Kiritimatiellia bacterium]
MSWIKVDCMLIHKPKVVKIARELNLKRETILGYLIKFWALADGITEDGRLDGYGPDDVDDLVGLPGFGRALEVVDWLRFNTRGAVLPRFDLHNGESAKKRANTSLRVSRHRRLKCNAESVTNVTDTALSKALGREDKRRVDSESLPGAGVCTPAREDAPSNFSIPLICDAIVTAEAMGWPKEEVEKWWLWNDARGWKGMVNWQSALAMWMKRARPESSEPNGQPVKISAPPAALEMDVSVEVD